MEIGEYHSMVEYSMDRINETDQGIIRTIKVNLEEEILEKICDPQIRIMEVKNLEVDIEKNYRSDNYERGRSRSRDRWY